MKKRKPLTLGMARARWNRRRREYERCVEELRWELQQVRKRHEVDLRKLRAQVAGYEREERDRRRAEEMNFAAFDRCESEVTRQERELFEASPAYKKYLRERAAREELQPFSQEHKAKAMLQSGNWRAP